MKYLTFNLKKEISDKNYFKNTISKINECIELNSHYHPYTYSPPPLIVSPKERAPIA